MSEIIEKNKHYLVKSQYGTYKFNNRKTAEQLNKTLTDYETIAKQSAETDKKLDNIQRTIISLQMSISIIGDELERLHKEVIQ
jgi:cytidylate kinase